MQTAFSKQSETPSVHSSISIKQSIKYNYLANSTQQIEATNSFLRTINSLMNGGLRYLRYVLSLSRAKIYFHDRGYTRRKFVNFKHRPKQELPLVRMLYLTLSRTIELSPL